MTKTYVHMVFLVLWLKLLVQHFMYVNIRVSIINCCGFSSLLIQASTEYSVEFPLSYQ